MRRMIRGIIDSVIEGSIKRISLKGFFGESIEDREYFQHFGFTSRPLLGAECIVIREGNHFVIIASDDRRYRIALEEGEVALYTDEGDKIHMKRGRVIEAVTETLLVKAATKVRFETPLVETTNNIEAVGEITDRRDSDGKSMSQMRGTYNGHQHPENDNGGPTSAPNEQM